MANFVDVFSFFVSEEKESEIETNNRRFSTLLSFAACEVLFRGYFFIRKDVRPYKL